MADYYSLLAKAVSNLPKAGPEPARKAIYERARKALVRQLRSLGPALSEADIAREEAALERRSPSSKASSRPLRSAPGCAGPPCAFVFAGRAGAPSPPSAASLRPGETARPPSFVPTPRPAPPASGARTPAPDRPPARPALSLSSPPQRLGAADASFARPGAVPSLSERSAAPGPPVRPAYTPSPFPPRPESGGFGSAPPPLTPRLPAAVSRYAPSPPPSRYAPPPRRAEPPSYLPEAPSLGRADGDEFVEGDAAPVEGADDLEFAAYAPTEADTQRPSAPTRLEGSRRNVAAMDPAGHRARHRAFRRRFRLPLAAAAAGPGDQGADRDADSRSDGQSRQDRRAGRRRVRHADAWADRRDARRRA